MQYNGLDSTAASEEDEEEEEDEDADEDEAEAAASIGAAPQPGRLPDSQRCAKSSEQRASSVGMAYSGRMRAWNEVR